jgi:hypothetical protein
MNSEPLLVGRKQAAQMLGISVRALDYLIAGRKLTTRRIGSRVLLSVSELRRFASVDHPFTVVPNAQNALYGNP